MLGDFISVFYKLLICQCEREVLKRSGQQCMLSSIKWSLCASPAGISLQRCSSAGLLLVSLVVSLWLHSPSFGGSPLFPDYHIQNIAIPVFHFGILAMSSFAKNTCVCASVRHGLKAQFNSMQETGTCKPREY